MDRFCEYHNTYALSRIDIDMDIDMDIDFAINELTS
jgi:hypothetical protein